MAYTWTQPRQLNTETKVPTVGTLATPTTVTTLWVTVATVGMATTV
jgi:hypothetical protein